MCGAVGTGRTTGILTFDDAVVLQGVHVSVALVLGDLAAAELVEDFPVGRPAREDLPSAARRLVLRVDRLALQHLPRADG